MRLVLFISLALAALPVQADIYKHVDADGHVTYSNTPRPGAKRIITDPARPKAKAASAAPRARASSTPADFPRVDPATQRQRDTTRRQLLLDELKAEEDLLAAARSALANAPSKSGSDAGKLAESLRLHEKNIEMLQKELAHIR